MRSTPGRDDEIFIDKRYASSLLFFDMETTIGSRHPGTGIVLFDLALRTLLALWVLATLASVVLVGLYLTQRGPIVVPSKLDAPYAIRLLDEAERQIVVGIPGHVTGQVNFDIGQESRFIKQPPEVLVNLRVNRNDFDTRAVLSAALLATLGFGWAVLLNLQAIVWSARRGDPFDPVNTKRLRRVAAVMFAIPLLGVTVTQVIGHTLESDPPVHPVTPGLGWLAFVVAGLGVLALAEVFREGAALRAFEQETI